MPETLRQIQFGFYLGEEVAVFSGLFPGEFAVVAADGEVVLVFGLGGLQISLYARDGGVKVLLAEFAFPDGDDGPGEGVEALGVEFVAGDVAGHFLTPELLVGLGNGVLGATAVAVPEAAVDEDDGAVLGQDEVGGAGEALVIEPVPVAFVPQCVPDSPLRGCVPGTDAGHVVRPLGRGQNVRHITMALMGHLYRCCRRVHKTRCHRGQTDSLPVLF